MNVKVFRLNSGEEVLARFEEKGDFWVLKDAQMIHTNQQGLGLVPWLFYTSAPTTGVEVPKSYVAFMVEPSADMKATFDSTLNKGLVTPAPAKTKGLKLVT